MGQLLGVVLVANNLRSLSRLQKLGVLFAVSAVLLGAVVVGVSFKKPSEFSVDRSSTDIQERQGLLLYRGAPFRGVLVERYPNGGIYSETHYVEGLKEGRAQEYTLAGGLKTRWNFHLNQKDGFQEGWFAEGPKRFEFHFHAGILEGEQLEWHQNGTLFRRQIFRDGVETDKKILYSSSEVFSNYKKRDQRIYGRDGGALCFDPPKKEGER